MSCYNKEKTERYDYNNICKSHSARSDRAELYRICPSKLSKRELEDLYFSLLENNLDLKRTINGQQDKIKGLSTKVQRMTAAQRVLQGKEMKECCVGTKSIVSEQKESLTELKRANARMAERIRMLNMRLCSAKQFFKKAPQMSTSRCIRCATASTPKKHNCLDKQSEPVLKLSTSCQYLDRDAVSMRSAQTETRDLEKQNEEMPCDENKCRSLMEELKLKIFSLQEELSTVHTEYSARIGRLEAEVLEVRKENVRVCGERRISEHELQHATRRNSDLLSSLRTTEGRCAELSTQLSIEKRKVAELETRLKAATISDRVNKTIEDHSQTKLIETSISPQDTKYVQPENGKLPDIPEVVCTCPRVKSEKDSNNNTCASVDDEDTIVTTTTKSPFGKFSIKSKSSKNTSSKAMPASSKSVICGCLVSRESEFMDPSPIKETKCVSCACSVWKDSEFVQSTPTKADVVESAPTKETKCESCSCTGRHENEPYDPTSMKTGIHSSPNVDDTRGSPRAYHEDGKMSKASDDSGYMDANRSQDTPDEASLNKLNKELIRKIIELQNQVDSMKIAGASELPGAKQYKLSENDRTSFSGESPSTAMSAWIDGNLQQVEKTGTISGIQKRIDETESSLPVRSNRPSYDMSDIRELNKSSVQPSIQLDTIEDVTSMKAPEERTSKLKAAAEERRLSKLNGQMLSNGRMNGHCYSDDTNLVPDKLEITTDDERDPELVYDSRTEFIPDKLNMPTDKRAPELDYANGKLVINDFEGQNKSELVPTKLKVPDIIESRRGSDIGDITSKLATNGDRVPNITENRRVSDSSTSKVPANGDRVPNITENRHVSDTTTSVVPTNGDRVPNNTENRRISDISTSKVPPNEDRVPNITENRLPMTEDVPAKNEPGNPTEQRRLSKQDRTNSKEDFQLCPACTFETECSLHPYVKKINPKNKENGAKNVQGMKNDRHNSLQIPGPIPTTNTYYNNNNKEWKKSMFRRSSADKKKDSNTKDKPGKQKKPTKENKDKANIRERLRDSYETTSGPLNVPDVPVLHNDKATEMSEWHDDSRKNFFEESKDSIHIHQKRLSNIERKDSAAPVNDVSMNNFYQHSDNVMASMSSQYNQDQGTQMEQNTDEKAQGQTVTINNNVVQEEKTQNQQRRKFSLSDQGTYTVGSKQNRSTSPDNTDLEMSYMSDLPYEKDEPIDCHALRHGGGSDSYEWFMNYRDKKGGMSRPLSPGEDKMTTTYTDSYCSPATNYSLSEGEVPSTSARKIEYENGKEKTTSAKPAQEVAQTPSQTMDAALQAISNDLARCKTLLTSQRPTEQSPLQGSKQSQSQTSMADNSRPIALRRGVATQSIGDTYTPKCIFTLHIGTVVLSDEAVLGSRNKSLLLMWKFYDQNVAMTRMRAGRVVVFDFSTEYDIKITDDFLSYMKHAELPIIICELDKEREPFATCTLPLRDPLLHTNRRADMSLALVAGPQMLSARAQSGAADALDAGDELGVIDLWCMLRADANMLPGINLAISQPPASAPVNKRHHSHVMQQILDDDHSNECADLDLTLQNRNTAPPSGAERTGKNVCQDVEFTRTSHHWSSPLQIPAIPTTTTKVEETYDASKYPPVRIRSSSVTFPSPHAIDADTSTPRTTPRNDSAIGPEHDESRIIINEVKAKIKTPSDMKHALERSSQSEFSRIPKTDEEVTSHAHSSLGSSRGFFARLQRRGSPRTEQQRRDSNQRSSMLQNVRRASKSNYETPIRMKERDDTSELEIYKKYENISKLLGSNRAESKKCVTIVPQYIEPVLDEPQRLEPTQDVAEEDPERSTQRLEITVLWLALNEECEAMVDPHVQRVYVAYSFLGRSGADLETPVSLPKPKHYVDKCYFNFKKKFDLEDSDLPLLGHMARCRTGSKVSENEKNCIIFSVISEPPEDPLGLENCEDIGYAYLYLGDLVAYSGGSSSYTSVIPVRGASGAAAVCGVLAVRLDGLHVLRRCLLLSSSQRDLADWSMH